MALDNKRPIIIKKVKKGGHGHYGGAWKIAYADLMTAMMAFFLMMWLLGATTEAQKKGIADYFANPMKVSLSGGDTSGDTTSVLQGGGMDVRHDVGQMNLGDINVQDNLKNAGDTDAEIVDEDDLLEMLNESLAKAIEFSPLLKEYRDQLKIDFTRDGLRIQIVDAEKRPMFPLASGRLLPHAEQILAQLVPLLKQLPNKITIVGHTDAIQWVANGRDYSNWELSADRANAARRVLRRAGLAEDRIVRASGMADVTPFDKADPRAPVNRRIALVVLNSRAERALLEADGSDVGGGPDGSPPEALNRVAPGSSGS